VTLRADRCDLFGNDWWVITDDGEPITDAAVEGTSTQMHELARAIRSSEFYSARRCAVQPEDGDIVLWSPRNSQRASRRYSRADALALAEQIEREVPE
jgi:hypothetical protein